MAQQLTLRSRLLTNSRPLLARCRAVSLSSQVGQFRDAVLLIRLHVQLGDWTVLERRITMKCQKPRG